MGLSASDAQLQAQRLSLPESQSQAPPEKGHGRGRLVIDHRRGADEALRGVPVIGIGAGAVSGTRPGDSVLELVRAEGDVLRARLHRNRFKPA